MTTSKTPEVALCLTERPTGPPAVIRLEPTQALPLPLACSVKAKLPSLVNSLRIYNTRGGRRGRGQSVVDARVLCGDGVAQHALEGLCGHCAMHKVDIAIAIDVHELAIVSILLWVHSAEQGCQPGVCLERRVEGREGGIAAVDGDIASVQNHI